MSKTLRRVMAIISGWFGVLGLVLGLNLMGPWVSPWLLFASFSFGLCACASAFALWRPRAWAAKAVIAMGLAGVTFIAASLGSARSIPVDAVPAASIGAVLFLATCVFSARRLARASRPAI